MLQYNDVFVKVLLFEVNVLSTEEHCGSSKSPIFL